MRVGGGWVGEGGLGGGGLGEGMVVARADRDVSTASVISRRLGSARVRLGAHESSGMMGQTTLTTLAGGRAGRTNQSEKK